MKKHKIIFMTAVCGVALALSSCRKQQGSDPSTPTTTGTKTGGTTEQDPAIPTSNAGGTGGFVIQRASWGSVQEPIPEPAHEPDITRMGFEAGQRLLNQRKAAKRLKNMEIFIRR